MEINEEMVKKVAECCRIMRVEGRIRRFTPEGDALEILSLVKELDQKDAEQRKLGYLTGQNIYLAQNVIQGD